MAGTVFLNPRPCELEQVMVPRPIALGLTLCDSVIVEERTKKISLIGTFTNVAVERFPALAPPFSVFAVLTDGAGDGRIDVGVTHLGTDLEINAYQGQLHFPDKLSEVVFHFRLRQLTLPAAGFYQFTLLVDGEWVAQRRIRVYKRGKAS